MTPTENESPEDFAARAADEVQSFFGEAEAAEAPAAETEEPAVQPAAEPTDETAETEPETVEESE